MTTALLCLVALLAFSNAACPPDVSSYSVWPTAWNKAGNAINIAANQKIIVTTSPGVILGAVNVSGILRFADASIQFNTTSIFVKAGGSLIAGTEECPINNKLYITLHGDAPEPRTLNLIGTDPYDNTAYGSKGIVTAWNGTVQLYGKYTGPTWTHLSQTARNGTLTITLLEPVSWAVGDQIFITNTDLAESLNSTIYPKMSMGQIRPDQHEQRKIVTISADKKTLTLDSRLVYTHYADEHIQAEVGLLTRRIVIQGDEASENEDFGGHLLARRGPAVSSTVISGVEFYRMGQTNVLGRYPIHIHVNHLLYGMNAKVVGNSVHKSYQRCISIHESHGLLIEDNVSFDIVGHCYFLEDGSEMGNVLNRNLGSRVLPMVPPLLYHDKQPSVFWISNPNNTFTNNAASGSNIGYWYALPADKPNGAGKIAYPNLVAKNMPFGGFINNTAHSMMGWCLDSATMDGYTELIVLGWGGGKIQFINYKAYKCNSGAIWNRGRPAEIMGGYWADFGQMGLLPLNGQITSNITLVARSNNVGLYAPASESCGISNYDTGGCTGSIGNTFINFTGDRYGAFCDTIGSPQYIPPVNWGIRNKYINAQPTFITGGTQSFYGVSMRAFFDDGSGTGVPYGGFMAGYQPYWNVSGNGGTWSPSTNSITIPYFHGGMMKVGIWPTNSDTGVPVIDKTVYGRVLGKPLYRNGFYYRPLGQNATAPGIHNTEWQGGYESNFPSYTSWAAMFVSSFAGNGIRRIVPSSFKIVVELAKLGDWMIIALPFPKKPEFTIVMENPVVEFTAVQSYKDLEVSTYFWNAEDNHLYVTVSCDPSRGSLTGFARNDFRQYRTSCKIGVNADYDETNRNASSYIEPKVPTVVPEWTKYTKFSARMYSKVEDIGALVHVQLSKKGFTGYPSITWQTYHNQTDPNNRINFRDASGNLLWPTDPVSLTGAGNMRYITSAFWTQINQGLVYITMDLNGKEIMRANLVAEEPKTVTTMSVSSSGFSCTPTYKTASIFSEALYNKSVSFKMNSGFSAAVASNNTALCGQFSLYTRNNNIYYSLLNISVPLLPQLRVADYTTLEFAVRGEVLGMIIDLNVWSLDSSFVLRKVAVDGSNNYNQIIDENGWSIVRIPLSQLGGSSITTLGFQATNFNAENNKDGAVYLYIDEIRLSGNSLAPQLSFAATTIKTPITSTIKTPTVKSTATAATPGGSYVGTLPEDTSLLVSNSATGLRLGLLLTALLIIMLF